MHLQYGDLIMISPPNLLVSFHPLPCQKTLTLKKVNQNESVVNKQIIDEVPYQTYENSYSVESFLKKLRRYYLRSHRELAKPRGVAL